MPFKTKWSPDVKAGVLALKFDRDISLVQAHARAVEGSLPPVKPGGPRPAPAPGLPIATARDWCRHERARRAHLVRAAASPGDVLGETVGHLALAHARACEKAAKDAARGKLAPGTIGKLARDGVELARLAAAVNGQNVPRSNGDDGAKPGAMPAGFLEVLAAAPDSENP